MAFGRQKIAQDLTIFIFPHNSPIHALDIVIGRNMIPPTILCFYIPSCCPLMKMGWQGNSSLGEESAI